MIRASGLTKEFGIRRAIDNLTFQAEQGEIVGFLGPNGAGKTTTMRILSGYMPPTEGEATVAGYDIISESIEVRRRVGYLPETVPLYPDMTVFDYLKFMADLRHLPNAEDRVDDTLEMVGMEERADGYIGNLSKGMRQRIGLAQALLHKPEVLILDEPTIGLDPAQIREIRELIRNLRGEHTIMLSTHILAEVTQVCDGVVIINEGRLMASGSLEELTASFRRDEGVVVRVRRGGAEAAAAARGIPGVGRAEAAGNEVRVEWSPGRDLREEVASLAVGKGFGLLEMRPVAMNIEDLYLQIVSGGSEQ